MIPVAPGVLGPMGVGEGCSWARTAGGGRQLGGGHQPRWAGTISPVVLSRVYADWRRTQASSAQTPGTSGGAAGALGARKLGARKLPRPNADSSAVIGVVRRAAAGAGSECERGERGARSLLAGR